MNKIIYLKEFFKESNVIDILFTRNGRRYLGHLELIDVDVDNTMEFKFFTLYGDSHGGTHLEYEAIYKAQLVIELEKNWTMKNVKKEYLQSTIRVFKTFPCYGKQNNHNLVFNL